MKLLLENKLSQIHQLHDAFIIQRDKYITQSLLQTTSLWYCACPTLDKNQNDSQTDFGARLYCPFMWHCVDGCLTDQE